MHMASVVWPYTLASLHCLNGARPGFTDQREVGGAGGWGALPPCSAVCVPAFSGGVFRWRFKVIFLLGDRTSNITWGLFSCVVRV